MDKIEIYSSKKKAILTLVGSAAFVVLGIWLMLHAEELATYRDPAFIRIIGLAAILFFGLGIFAGAKRMIRSEVGLIIDSTGLNVYPQRSRTDFIKWEDILGFEEIKIKSTRIQIIKVRDPQYWLEKEKSAIRKKLMEFNISHYGSPFNIAAAGLDIRAAELNDLLIRYFEKYGTKQAHHANNVAP